MSVTVLPVVFRAFDPIYQHCGGYLLVAGRYSSGGTTYAASTGASCFSSNSANKKQHDPTGHNCFILVRPGAKQNVPVF